MSDNAGYPDLPRGSRNGRAGFVLVVASVVFLVVAGLLLWKRSGDAVFSDLVLAALAWCF
jgi:hypothetical protein